MIEEIRFSDFRELQNHLKVLVDQKRCKSEVSIGVFNSDTGISIEKSKIRKRNSSKISPARSEFSHIMDEEAMFRFETGALIVRWKTITLSSTELLKCLSVKVADFCVYSLLRCLGYELRVYQPVENQNMCLERMSEVLNQEDEPTCEMHSDVNGRSNLVEKIKSNFDSSTNFHLSESRSWWSQLHMNEDFRIEKAERISSCKSTSHFPLSIMKFYPKCETWKSHDESISLLKVPTISMNDGQKSCGEYMKLLPTILTKPGMRVSDDTSSTRYSVIKGAKRSEAQKKQDFLVRVIEVSNPGIKWRMNNMENEVLALFDHGDISHLLSNGFFEIV